MARLKTRRPLLRWLPLEDRITPASLLPDLVPDVANLAGWTVGTVGGVTELSYSTGMQNLGKGAFELRGTTGPGSIITNTDGTQSQLVVQRLYQDDASTPVDRDAGRFAYHPTHGHVHYDDFAHGRIRTRPSDTDWTQGTVVAIGPKTSFCLLDLSRNHPELPGSPASGVYNSCGSAVQGISVGWKDIYSSGLDGQQIDITGLPNGKYWLEVEADPMFHVLETDETNNTTRIMIELTSQPDVGLRIQTSSPLGAQNGPVSYIDLNFNQAINVGSFTKDDVTLNGPAGAIPVTSITQNSAVSYRVNFASQGKVGTYTANIGPNILGTDGKALNQDNDSNYGEATDDIFTNVFAITAPRVMATSPSGATVAPINTVRLQYNKPLDSGTVTFADIVSFTGPGGGNLMGQVTGLDPVTTTGSSALWDVTFASMTGLGTYTLVIGSGMADTLGNTIDQDGDFDTDAADQYTATFTIVPVGTVGPDAFGYSGATATYENLSALTGWTTIINSADDANATVSLGTNTFNLYGTSYTGASKMYINSNGLMTFGGGTSAYENNDLSSMTYSGATVYHPALAVLWDDMNKGPGTPQVRGLFQDTTGDGVSDRYIAQWNQVYPYGTSASGMTFSAILELNTGTTPGNITFNYQDLDAGNLSFTNGASATVGLRANGNGAAKLVVNQNSGSNALVNSLKAVKLAVPKVASIVRMDPATIEAGDAEFLVTFTDPVTGVDLSDFTITTTGGVVGATVEHLHTTADPMVYELHVDTGVGSGTVRLNLADNDSIITTLGAKLGGTGAANGSFTAGQVYTVVQPAPEVQGINVGDGTAQRSRLDQIQVVFDTSVIFVGNPADAFLVSGPNGLVTVAVDFSGSAPNQTTARLTFSGAGTEYGSLKDGNYTLTVLSSKISTGGVFLDGDGNGSAGGDYSASFHRLFGDVDGNSSIDGTADFAAFGAAFGTTGVGSAFDFNGDGTIDGATDFARFGANFGMTM